MIRNISRFKNSTYDVIVIGAGINGAAISYMASQAGLKVALLEKNDFASGTSSKSSKLLHGGIRYLENFEFDLVEEALKERYIQYKNAPHLVKPLSFVIPVYKTGSRPLWMMKLGVWLYDVLSRKYSLGSHEHLTAQQVLAVAPDIVQEGLVGGVSYWDAQMNDTRICLENVLMADMKGAHVANYVEVVEFIKEHTRCVGVVARDVLTQETFEIRAKTVIATAGPWTDQILRKDSTRNNERLRPTKGVHVLFKEQVSQKAFALQSQADKRVFFVIPFKEYSLIGTTDTDYQGKPDDVKVDQEDIAYLLKEAGRIFPKINFNKEKIIATFAGVRPLVYDKGAPSKISRKHIIEKTFSGLWYVAGGKYTTYRAIACECIAQIWPQLRQQLPSQEQYPLYGSQTAAPDFKKSFQRFGVESKTISYLMEVYGSRYEDVLRLTEEDHSLRARLCECSLAIRAQVAYACKVEMAKTFEDVYSRRLELQYNDCPTRQCRKSTEEVFKAYAS